MLSRASVSVERKACVFGCAREHNRAPLGGRNRFEQKFQKLSFERVETLGDLHCLADAQQQMYPARGAIRERKRLIKSFVIEENRIAAAEECRGSPQARLTGTTIRFIALAE